MMADHDHNDADSHDYYDGTTRAQLKFCAITKIHFDSTNQTHLVNEICAKIIEFKKRKSLILNKLCYNLLQKKKRKPSPTNRKKTKKNRQARDTGWKNEVKNNGDG